MFDLDEIDLMNKVKKVSQLPSMILTFGGNVLLIAINVYLLLQVAFALGEAHNTSWGRFFGMGMLASVIGILIPSIFKSFDKDGLSFMEKATLIGMVTGIVIIQGFLVFMAIVAEEGQNQYEYAMTIMNIFSGIIVDIITGMMTVLAINEIKLGTGDLTSNNSRNNGNSRNNSNRDDNSNSGDDSNNGNNSGDDSNDSGDNSGNTNP